MSGTKNGGLKAAATNRKRYGKNFYKNIGAKGGRLGTTGGFAANPALAKIAGVKGGHLSKRCSKKYFVDDKYFGIFDTVNEAIKFFKKLYKNVKKSTNGKLIIENHLVETENV